MRLKYPVLTSIVGLIGSPVGVEGLGDALQNLQHLNLSQNLLTSVSPIAHLQRLEVLLVSHNLMTTLEGVSTLKRLNRLDASHNRIQALEDICAATSCPLLGTLSLIGNPVLLVQDYRLHVVYFLPQACFNDALYASKRPNALQTS